jgi:PHB/PHA accumulation regulator DNA-binding domain
VPIFDLARVRRAPSIRFCLPEQLGQLDARRGEPYRPVANDACGNTPCAGVPVVDDGTVAVVIIRDWRTYDRQKYPSGLLPKTRLPVDRVTLDNLAEMVRMGRALAVYDAKTGEDITRRADPDHRRTMITAAIDKHSSQRGRSQNSQVNSIPGRSSRIAPASASHLTSPIGQAHRTRFRRMHERAFAGAAYAAC